MAALAGWLGRPESPDVRDTLDRYCIQAFLSRFSRPVSGFPLTYHIELIDEVSMVFSVGEEALISFAIDYKALHVTSQYPNDSTSDSNLIWGLQASKPPSRKRWLASLDFY